MSQNTFDVTVIGSGPGGYVCAIQCAKNGLSTALVEKDPHLGGTCLNVGCIPSKALLHSSEQYHFARESAADHGIRFDSVSPDIAALMKRKSAVVDQLRKGVAQLCKGNQIKVFQGTGQLAGKGSVKVSGDDGEVTLETKQIVIATGSGVAELPALPIDGESIVTSDHAIAFDSVPERLLVVGAGAIGLELGSVWARLGSKVTVVEFLPRIAATFDEEISRMAQRIFRKQGLTFHTGTKVTGCEKGDGGIRVTAEKGDKEIDFEADRVLVAVGRKPYIEGLGLEKAGVELTDRGRIRTDENYRTSVEGVYAIGDVIDGPMLAHKAEEDGVAVADLIAGKHADVNYALVPNVIYTHPEVASVGISAKEAEDQEREVRTSKFALAANGRAIAAGETDGFVKIVADAATDRILGVQLIAANASEIIAAACAHMAYGGTAEDLGHTIHAHPTIAESLKEAALGIHGRAIHAL